ncbi:MAG: hypothetical protein ACRC62_01300 [Microcoleus sp.]
MNDFEDLLDDRQAEKEEPRRGDGLMEEDPKTWYITRYCLTSGIQEVIGDLCDRGTYVIHGSRSDQSFSMNKIGIDAFPTLEEAREDQRKRAAKAIASAEKKIAKLKELL